MGDRHGDCFARRGRALSPLRRDFPTARGGLPMARGGGQDLPRAETLSSAKASRHGARAKRFAPRENAPLGEGFPTRRTSERVCPAQKRSPRRRPPDTAHGRKDLPAQEHAPRRRPPDTAHERKDLPAREHALRRGRTRDRARAKGFAPRRNAPHGESLPTRRTSKRICPARERSPRRRPPDTARCGGRDLPRAGTLPRRRPLDTAHERKNLPHGGSRSPHGPTNGGPPSTDGQPKNTPSAGSHPRRCGRCRVHSH